MSTPHLHMAAYPTTDQSYAQYVNPQWVRLLNMLGLNRRFINCSGCELTDDEGNLFLDFLSGYGVYNVGHHHPYITSQLIEELNNHRPTMLQSTIPPLAAQLAERLCRLAKGRCEKVFFTSSGSEGVESAIKFARAKTRRDWILYADGGFHGLTCGALSLMSNPWWRTGFGPLLLETQGVPFGDLDAVASELATERYAAYIVEPIQGESGILLPPPGYFKEVQRLCDLYGTLLVMDEVQTGLHRCGPFLASHDLDIQPDMVILAKALSGGQVPVGALLMRSDLCNAVYSSIDRAFIHASTFGENSLAMRAGLATLDVLANEKLGEQSTRLGILLRSKLQQRLANFEMVKEVRGAGLFNAIEFMPPRSFGLKLLYSAFSKAHPGLFGQMVVKALFEARRILSQMAGNNYLVIKSLPPLVLTEAQLDRYVDGVALTCQMIAEDKAHFWAQGVSIARKAFAPLPQTDQLWAGSVSAT